MLSATKDRPLATTITGSIPRPAWFELNLGRRTFRQGMGDSRYREQYQDAVKKNLEIQQGEVEENQLRSSSVLTDQLKTGGRYPGIEGMR